MRFNKPKILFAVLPCNGILHAGMVAFLGDHQELLLLIFLVLVINSYLEGEWYRVEDSVIGSESTSIIPVVEV